MKYLIMSPISRKPCLWTTIKIVVCSSFMVFFSVVFSGCDAIVKEITYNPKCVNGYYVYPAGYENQGEWGLQNLFCEEIDTGGNNSAFKGSRCMKVFGDPRIKYDVRFSNVIYAPTKCFNTMAGVKEHVQQ